MLDCISKTDLKWSNRRYEGGYLLYKVVAGLEEENVFKDRACKEEVDRNSGRPRKEVG